MALVPRGLTIARVAIATGTACPTLRRLPTFLLKTEPSEYSYADLQRDKRTTWSGVKNAAALIHLRTCATGDEVLIYHTGDEKAIVGLAKVVRGAYEDPSRISAASPVAAEPTSKSLSAKAGGPKWAVIDLVPLRAATTPVTLACIKADVRFKEFARVRQSRLSVMPVPSTLSRVLRDWAGL